MSTVKQAVERSELTGQVTLPDLAAIVYGRPDLADTILRAVAIRGGVQYDDIVRGQAHDPNLFAHIEHT
ncbi:hypothetical protein [Gordonia malaquae]|uniref:hypothetical protein n=1 Tax=Gordonia malaquae TaxID=410332 RepID=UPI003018ED83